MPECSTAQGGMLAPYAQQALHVSKKFLLFARLPLVRERVLRVPWPASGEVAAIVGDADSRQADFVAVIEFRNPPQRKRQSERQSQLRRRGAALSGKTTDIVIPEKGHQILRVRIHRVLPQNVGDAPRRGAVQKH